MINECLSLPVTEIECCWVLFVVFSLRKYNWYREYKTTNTVLFSTNQIGLRTNIINYGGIKHPAGLFCANYNRFCSRYSISIKKVYYRDQKYVIPDFIFWWARRFLTMLLCTCSSNSSHGICTIQQNLFRQVRIKLREVLPVNFHLHTRCNGNFHPHSLKLVLCHRNCLWLKDTLIDGPIRT